MINELSNNQKVIIKATIESGGGKNIQVIDEDFGQPYDYQYMLENNPNFTLALLVRKCVEEQMQKLQDAGILSGHNKYDYI